jgi:hypothetical protein
VAGALRAGLLGVAAIEATAQPSAGDRDRRAEAVVECVVQHSHGSFTAHFGYSNDGPEALSLPVGPANAFVPAPAERGQPTVFAPGRSPRFPRSAFAVDFDGHDLTWTLAGPDGRAHTATASASSRRCTAADAGVRASSSAAGGQRLLLPPNASSWPMRTTVRSTSRRCA